MDEQQTKQVICEKPRIIINPQLPSLISKYGIYQIRDKVHNVSVRNGHPNWNYLYNFDYRPFSVKNNHIIREDLDKCFVLSPEGEMFPIYLEVPCGHCILCKNAKVNSFVERCRLETQLYDSKPWFITLTYDDEHLPQSGVQVRHVQLFMKRFRINLERAGYTSKLRYCAVGEYGKNTHRPHYHLLVWNLNCFDTKAYTEVSSILDNSWKFGYNMHRLVDPSNDKAFYYTAKYLRKDGKVPFYPVRDIVDDDGNVLCTEIEPCNGFFCCQAADVAALVQDFSKEFHTLSDYVRLLNIIMSTNSAA